MLPVGFEPTTIRLELFCSGPLSYGSKVDAHFGSRKATTLFQRSNSFFFGILLLPRHPRFPPSFRAWSADTTVFAMLRLHMALCHASCSRQASNLRRTPFRGVPLPVGLRELGRLLPHHGRPSWPISTWASRKKRGRMGCRSWGRMGRYHSA